MKRLLKTGDRRCAPNRAEPFGNSGPNTVSAGMPDAVAVCTPLPVVSGLAGHWLSAPKNVLQGLHDVAVLVVRVRLVLRSDVQPVHHGHALVCAVRQDCKRRAALQRLVVGQTEYCADHRSIPRSPRHLFINLRHPIFREPSHLPKRDLCVRYTRRGRPI